jgi:hypothetical protein
MGGRILLRLLDCSAEIRDERDQMSEPPDNPSATLPLPAEVLTASCLAGEP